MSVWKNVKLGDVSEVVSKGTTPTTLGHSFAPSGVPFLRAEDVANGKINPSTVAFYISPETHSFLFRSQLLPGDFLITIAGTLGRVGYVPQNCPPLNCNQAVAFARLKPLLVDSQFACLICQSEDVISPLLNLKKIGTIGNLNLEQVREMEIPLPPLVEQKRIVAILEKAVRLRRLRRYAQQMSETYLQSVFRQMFGDCLNDNSPKTYLGELVEITGGGTPSREVARYFEGDTPWLTAKDMRGDYIFDTQEHITEEAIKNSATKLIPANSILIVVKSKVLMHRLPLAIAQRAMCHGQDIKSVQCSERVNPLFIKQVLKYNEPKLLAQARGANTEGLNLDMLESVPVPDVSISRQNKFAHIVRQFERLRSQQREAERQAEHLFQTLLHRAFRGEL